MIRIKLFIIFIFGSSILSSCSISEELRKERKQWDYNHWNDKFKERAFCLCQLRSFENVTVKNNLQKFDKSYYDALSIAIFDKAIEAQIIKEINTVRLDSINAIGTYPDDLKATLQKRNVFYHCFEFYKSKRLDSLAKKQEQYWKKIPSIINEIWKEIPTY